MPRTGEEIETPDGVGIVVDNNVITEKTKVKLTAEDGTIDIKEYPYEDLGPGAKERALERAAQAVATAEAPAAEGFTPLQQSSLPRPNRDRSRQPRCTEQPAAKGNDKQPKGEQKAQPKGDKPQQKGDKPQPKGDRRNQNRGGKGGRDKQPKPAEPSPKGEAPAPKADPVPASVTVVPVATLDPAPEAGAVTVPFSRKRRLGNRRRSFGPKTPGGTGGQKG